MIHSRGDRIVWDCPACGTENPIDSPLCSACGTPFRKVLVEPEEEIEVDPGRAAMWSLVFPGVGHIIIGRRGEGIARAVVFAFALMTGLVSLGAVTRGSGAVYLMLMILSLGAAAALYVVSTLDAGRAATRLPPLLPSRVLMYGGLGLMMASLVVVVTGAMGARG
ncbi:MAG: zinc ribbon domain-containing protein [Actinobacteria bacterium]|nr:zinc ribbon domain-containing protein [Actinomycetota bacterium]